MTFDISRTRSLGAILIDSGKLSVADAERILRLQKERNLRFGDAAVQLKLLADEDIQHALAQQYDYPYLRKGEGKVSDEIIAAYQPFAHEVESLRGLRSQLMLRWFSGEPGHNALAICSAGAGEGRSHLAANLAVIFSQLGERTLLIDADMRNPRQHELFRVENKSGLSSILAGRSSIEAIQRVPDFVALSLLTAGPVPPNPQELLGRSAYAELVSSCATQFDVVLVDTPAAAMFADAQTIAARAGAALIVVRKHQSSLADIQLQIEQMGQLGVGVVGSVLTEF